MSLRSVIHCGLLVVRYWRRRLRAAECDHVLPRLKTDDICIDVGAHCGSWTWPLAKRVPLGYVYAVEALPYYAGMLRCLARLLGFRNVRVLNYAVTRASMPLQLVWKNSSGRRLTGYTHLAGQGENVAGTLTVQGEPLSSLVPPVDWPRVKFIKCDVEGAELGVFQGAIGLLSRARPIVYSELNATYCGRYGHGVGEVFEFFRAMDYRAFVLIEGPALREVNAGNYSGAGDVWFYPAESAVQLLMR